MKIATMFPVTRRILLKWRNGGIMAIAAIALVSVYPGTPVQAADGAIWPNTGQVSSIYNRCSGTGTHYGIDIAAPIGREVYATQDGTVVTAAVQSGYGNVIYINHSNGYQSRYAHLSSFVRTSGNVRQGDLIARVGNTGVSEGPHLHFEMRRNGSAINFNSATYCGANVTAKTHVNYNFSGLLGSNTGPVYEDVANGGGTHIVGSNAYMDVSSTGQVYAWNGNYFGGSPGGYSGRIVDAKSTANNAGYWLLTSAGQVYAYGNAPYAGGSPSGYTGEIVAMAATPNSQGYVMVSSTGQVYAYGNAPYKGGSPAGYSGKFVDIEMTADGGGYWLLTSAGQVYTYGNAAYHGGSPSGFSRAMVALSPTPNGGGYVMVSKTGQVYSYGNAQYRGGSPAGINGEIADISYRIDSTPGYVMISTTGQHYTYDTPYLGNPSGFSGVF